MPDYPAFQSDAFQFAAFQEARPADHIISGRVFAEQLAGVCTGVGLVTPQRVLLVAKPAAASAFVYETRRRRVARALPLTIHGTALVEQGAIHTIAGAGRIPRLILVARAVMAETRTGSQCEAAGDVRDIELELFAQAAAMAARHWQNAA